MRFWDSSALVPLFVREALSGDMQALYESDPDVIVWWATEVECAAALERKARLGAPRPEIEAGLARLDAIVQHWTEVVPGHVLRLSARRLIRLHDVRMADALQLAAALTAAQGAEIVCLDDRLALAARREGFAVLPA